MITDISYDPIDFILEIPFLIPNTGGMLAYSLDEQNFDVKPIEISIAFIS